MRSSTHFTIALHVLTLLASHPGEALTSDFIAGSVNTNPVFIRRVLAALRRSRLVTSQTGPGGGWLLTHAARDVTLRDVFRATEEGALFALHSSTPNPKCPVGGNIQDILGRRFEATQRAVERELEQTTIADLVKEVQARSS
ncbi:MAG: Rrf2 family transcriptional regulator [Myxococcaceae bacterium]|nr:Rrf2 family transcriptional regulator [Myxococcaceae bacterium]